MDEKIPMRLIVRYLSGEALPAEQEQLFEWVAQDVRHQRTFNECVALWEKNHPLDEEFNTAFALQHLNYRLDALDGDAGKKSIGFQPWRRVAAAVGVFLIAGATLFAVNKYLFPVAKNISYVECTTRAGQKKTITLSDGSVITLNAKASLKYPQVFSGLTREVYLTGEAFFEIKKDASKPFIIHTGDLKTEVLGTSFNIKSSTDQTIVAVATGRVQVSSGTQRTILLPFEKITFRPTASRLEKAAANLSEILAWREDIILFNDTPLSEAASILSQRYGVEVHIENHAVGNCLITGKFKDETLQNLLQAIAFSTGVQFRIDKNKIFLYGKGCV